MGVAASCKSITIAYHMESGQSLCQFHKKKLQVQSNQGKLLIFISLGPDCSNALAYLSFTLQTAHIVTPLYNTNFDV